MRELIDRRVLGAIEFVDAVTAARVRDPLRLEPVDARVRIGPNRSALYVIRGAPGLDHHLGEFLTAPDTPAAEALSFDVRVADPARRYLARALRIRLPRKNAPTSDPASVLNPIVIPLYPAPAAAVGSNWAVLRVLVEAEGSSRGLGNVVVVASPKLAGFAPVTGLTDERGCALVAIEGAGRVLASGGGHGAVLTREFECDLELVLDRRVVSLPSDEAGSGSRVLADPEAIAADQLANHPDITVNPRPPVSLAAGKSAFLTVQVTWP